MTADLENVFDAGPFTESCLGHKAGQRESGHLTCSLGGGQSGGSLVHHQYLIVALLEAANQEVAIVHYESLLALLYFTDHLTLIIECMEHVVLHSISHDFNVSANS